VTATDLSQTAHSTSVIAIQPSDCPIQYAYRVCRMILSPRLPPMNTCAIATKIRPNAAARMAAAGELISSPNGPAKANMMRATITLTTNAIPAAIRTTERTRPG
jgi:hypothetical protein